MKPTVTDHQEKLMALNREYDGKYCGDNCDFKVALLFNPGPNGETPGKICDTGCDFNEEIQSLTEDESQPDDDPKYLRTYYCLSQKEH